jgi:hypothetical protein
LFRCFACEIAKSLVLAVAGKPGSGDRSAEAAKKSRNLATDEPMIHMEVTRFLRRLSDNV